LEDVILIAVVLGSVFGFSYLLAWYLRRVRERFVRKVFREAERAVKWRIYTGFYLPGLHSKIIDRYYESLGLIAYNVGKGSRCRSKLALY